MLVAASVLVLCACAVPANTSHGAIARRIVSLMPSLTEDLCAVGAQRQIVGVSEYSANIPCVRRVQTIGNAASIDAERIVQLHPDAVVGIPAQRLMTEPLHRVGIATLFYNDDAYADIFTDIVDLGALSGHMERARALAASLEQKTAALQRSARFARRLRVFVVIQAQPIWTVGPRSYIAQLLRLAGAQDAAANLPRPYAEYNAEALVRLQPDAIVATNDSGLRPALSREPWQSLRAVAEHHVYILSDDSILVRPGPRYVEGLAWLIDRLKMQMH